MQIRIAVPADQASIMALAIAFRDHLQRAAPTDHQFAASVAALLSSTDAEFFLASEDAEIVGYVLQRYRHSMWAGGTEATIEDLFVRPTGRRQGAGKRLMAYALARAIERGCATASLDTNEFNVASTKIYTDLGFSSWSERWNGRQVFFRKPLPSFAPLGSSGCPDPAG